MVSSRRLAREWALKVLYQTDVGKTPPEETLDAAMERLRREFVLRGSRAASGSMLEQLCLDRITADLRDILPGLSADFEQILAYAAGRLLNEAPYWHELRLEKSWRTQAPGVSLVPPRLLTPLGVTSCLPALSDPLYPALRSLSDQRRARLTQFVLRTREALQALLEPGMKVTARQQAKALAAARPLGQAPEDVQAFLREQREVYNQTEAERWHKVGAIVQKQTADWLRTAGFAVGLVHGVSQKRSQIDQAIEALSSGWRLERQVAVDRNILRLAGYEVLFMPGVPPGATINEAVELAKKYSTAESGRFVNGVLGSLTEQAGKITAANFDAEDPEDVLDLPDIGGIEENE